MGRLDGKTALISGAARGIGAQAARQMSAEGASVVLGDIDVDAGEQVAAQITASGGNAVFVSLDVSQEQDWIAAIASATQTFGKLDVLVNNAGLFLGKSIEEATLDEWNKLVAVNMTGVFLGTKLATDALRSAGEDSPQGSAIINMSSIAGLVASPLDPLYSMTKGGVKLFTKSMAVVLAKQGYRIRVNAVHPGVTDTDMGTQTMDARARTGPNIDMARARKESIERHPVGRLGTPTDIANAIVFLASDDAGFMTGSSLVADGGITAA